MKEDKRARYWDRFLFIEEGGNTTGRTLILDTQENLEAYLAAHNYEEATRALEAARKKRQEELNGAIVRKKADDFFKGK